MLCQIHFRVAAHTAPSTICAPLDQSSLSTVIAERAKDLRDPPSCRACSCLQLPSGSHVASRHTTPAKATVVAIQASVFRRVFLRMPESIGIPAGSLDDPSWHKPMIDMFTSSAQPWDYMHPDLPKFSEALPQKINLAACEPGNT
jgi:hypothetical protein